MQARCCCFALKTALRAAESVGSVGVITHPLDDSVRAFYAKWGFQDLPFDPRRAMIVRMVDLRKNGIAGWRCASGGGRLPNCSLLAIYATQPEVALHDARVGGELRRRRPAAVISPSSMT